MLDIFDIKESLNSFPVLWAAFYAIPIAFIVVLFWRLWEKWKGEKELIQTKILDPKAFAEEKLWLLSQSDPRYIQKLDFIVRKYLELTGTIVKWTRKTATEITKVEVWENVRTFILLTNRYKYAPENVSETEKENLLRMARNIIFSE